MLPASESLVSVSQMKVYCPTQLNWKIGEEVVGWSDEFSGDVYICGVSKRLEFYRQFEVDDLRKEEMEGSSFIF